MLRSLLVPSVLLAGACSFFGANASAQTYMSAHMWGWEAVPPTTSGAVGTGYLTYDTTSHALHYNISYVSLSSTETGATLNNAASGQTGPVLFTLPLGTPKIGTIVLSPSDEALLLAGNIYAQIESATWPTGEIRGQWTVATPPGPVYFCFGDGTATPCPCGNASPVGNQEGCLNSAGTGGRLRASGLQSVAVDHFELSVTGVTNAPTLFFQGTGAASGPSGIVFGDGLRCAGGTVINLGTKLSSAGTSRYPEPGDLGIAARGALPTGGVVTRTYQAWYRNTAPFCTTDGFNLTNGLQITWLP